MSNETAENTQPAQTPTEQIIIEDKTWRVALDKILQEIKTSTKSRERSLVITKIQESIMWLGMDLKENTNAPNPYPNSYNPSNTIVDKTADGLKL